MRLTRRIWTLLALTVLPGYALATTVTYQVRLSRAGQVLAEQSFDAEIGKPVILEHAEPFTVENAGCAAGNDDPTIHVNGTGKQGETITVTPQEVGITGVRTLVNLASAKVFRVVPTQAGTCKGQTVAMLKWDGNAQLIVSPGAPGIFRADDLTVTVNVIHTPPVAARAAGLAL